MITCTVASKVLIDLSNLIIDHLFMVVYFGNRAIQIHLISFLMKDKDYMNDLSSSGWKDQVSFSGHLFSFISPTVCLSICLS